MEITNPSFNFELTYAGERVNCEVVMQPRSYDISFDDRNMAAIVHTDEGTWMQSSGVLLTEDIIEEIGRRIEREYL